MELQEGMYVRTDTGLIAKLLEKDIKRQKYQFDNNVQWFYEYYRDDIDFDDYDDWVEDYEPKFANSLIDLIEEGDIIFYTHPSRKEPFLWSLETYNAVRNAKTFIEEKSITLKSIVTKEQFESLSYKVI